MNGSNGSIIFGIMFLVFGLIIWRRIKESHRPIKGSGIRILLPILSLVPVLYIFSQPPLQLTIWEIGVAASLGVLLAIPLVMTTNYEIRQDGQIYAQKNKSFFIALVAVLAIRIVARQYISEMDPASLSMLFITVAFSYITIWRTASFVKFKMVKQSHAIDKVMIPIKA
ncbi:cytochrome c biogenesis protein CcdC [Pseudoneobacillus sp. C159]